MSQDEQQPGADSGASPNRPVSARLEALLQATPAGAPTAPTSTTAPAPVAPAPVAPGIPASRRRGETTRLVLAGLVGALLASSVFLVIELARGPHGAASSPAARPLVAVPATPGALDPQAAPPMPGGLGGGGLFGQLQQQMQQALQGLGRGGPGAFSFRLGGDDADLDVAEDGDAVLVTARVKDAITDKFDVQVEGRMLTLRGQQRLGGGGGFAGTVSFSRSISLPADVDAGRMTTTVKDGTLRIRLPKK